MDSPFILQPSPSSFLISLIVFAAIFTQTVTGFGLALISMPLLALVMPIQTAAPLAALFGGVAEALLLLRYRAALNVRAVALLLGAALAGIPLGVYLLGQVDERVVTAVLGLIVLGYALYGLAGFRLPALHGRLWAVAFGFVAGILGGAYNTSGPPVIIYGACRRWPPAEFKSNLQGFFLVTGAVVLATHFLSGNITAVVWYNFFIAVPALLLALAAGFTFDKYINPQRFRRLVLLVLVLLGLSLIFI